jgi:hypothetical protein
MVIVEVNPVYPIPKKPPTFPLISYCKLTTDAVIFGLEMKIGACSLKLDHIRLSCSKSSACKGWNSTPSSYFTAPIAFLSVCDPPFKLQKTLAGSHWGITIENGKVYWPGSATLLGQSAILYSRRQIYSSPAKSMYLSVLIWNALCLCVTIIFSKPYSLIWSMEDAKGWCWLTWMRPLIVLPAINVCLTLKNSRWIEPRFSSFLIA